MLEGDVFLIYSKERKYQKMIYGEYENNPSLNLASFLVFLKDYIDRAISSYTQKWDHELPEWLLECREHARQGTAPVEAYEELIKIHALSGAALEAFSLINVDKWRENQDQKGETEDG